MNNKKNINRRQFFGKIWKYLGILAVAEFSWIGFSFLRKQNKEEDTNNNLFEAGAVSDFEKGSMTSFRSRRFYLHRKKDGKFLALCTSCTHLGCAINWNEEQQKFICPCHASHFDSVGNVLSPPAPRALNVFEISIKNGKVLVDTSLEIKRTV